MFSDIFCEKLERSCGSISLGQEGVLSPEFTALAFAAVIFAGGSMGLLLQRALPERYTTGGPRDMIVSVAGLIMFLSALVVGLLIWTAYGVYSSQNTAIQNFAARALQLDLALADYGPDAATGRAALRVDLARTIDQMWGSHSDQDFVGRNFNAAIENLRSMDTYLDTLHPSSDSQAIALNAAKQAAGAMGQVRLQMALALTDPISYPLLATVGVWVVVVFLGFGLTSRAEPMTFATLIVGALAVSSALYLIMDLSNPYGGVFQASSAPIQRVMSTAKG
jgi:Protein of unknown function (DUF4239)